jgi:hypothetical protein
MREGPAVQTVTRMTCLGCKYLKEEVFYESYEICTHKEVFGNNVLNNDTLEMPYWCPLFKGEDQHEAI